MLKKTRTQSAFISIFAIFFSAIVISILTALYVLLVKQMELMNLDSTSFQSLYTADSAFECVLYKEQNASDTASIFYSAANASKLGNCAVAGDANWQTSPDGKPAISGGRSKSVLNISLDTSLGKFCTVVTTNKNVADTSGFTLPPAPNYINFSGQSRDCSDASGGKVIERDVDFYY